MLQLGVYICVSRCVHYVIKLIMNSLQNERTFNGELNKIRPKLVWTAMTHVAQCSVIQLSRDTYSVAKKLRSHSIQG